MIRQAIDLKESMDGDLLISGGDLHSTESNTSYTYFQVIRMLLNSDPRENKFYLDLGINLSAFIGRENTKALGDEIARIIKMTISMYTVLYNYEVAVEAFPLSKVSIGFKITLPTIAPDAFYILAYDSMEHNIYSLNTMSESFQDTSF